MSLFHRSLVDRVELVDIEPTKWMACKAVLGAIANHANEEEADLSWPGVELLMLETGASESVVVRTTTLLHNRGWIVKKRRSGTSNLYRLNVAKLKAHQVKRSGPQPVFMAKHLEGMALPGEDSNQLTAKPSARRSTARSRASRASDQPTRQIDVKESSDRRVEHVKSTSPSGQIDDLSVSEPSVNRHLSIDAREDGPTDGSTSLESKNSPAAPEWALGLVLGLDYGPSQKRPSRKQAQELAGLVAAARDVHGLSEAEIVRHCRLTLRDATSNAVAYLRNGLVDHLPEPAPVRPAQAARPQVDGSAPEDLASRADFLPSRMRSPQAAQASAARRGTRRLKGKAS